MAFWQVTASDYALAQEFFEEAIVQDPTFGGGYRGIAFAQFQEAAVFQTRSLPEAQISAETLARRAVALDSIDAEAHACLGQALWARGELDGMLVEAKRALTISPNRPSRMGARCGLGVLRPATQRYRGAPDIQSA